MSSKENGSEAPLDTLQPEYFHGVYKANADPWNFETSLYEAAKYDATISSLPHDQYTRALEVGCSIGVLTERLATRCRALLAVDVSDQAITRAEQRCAALPNVSFARMQIPEQSPQGLFDLIVVSEVAYYWSAPDLTRAMDLLASHHSPAGHLILVHWTPKVPDYPLTGDQVHDAWAARPEYRPVAHHREEQYRLDVLERIG